MALIAHYINKGHSLDELLKLTAVEKAFFLAAWECEIENFSKMFEGVGNGK